MTGNFIKREKPCPETSCHDGWDDRENWYCTTCLGEGVLVYEVCEECGESENECPCVEEMEAAA